MKTLVSYLEDGVSVTKMESSIHVGVGEGGKVLVRMVVLVILRLFLRRSVDVEHTLPLPATLNLLLYLEQ